MLDLFTVAEVISDSPDLFKVKKSNFDILSLDPNSHVLPFYVMVIFGVLDWKIEAAWIHDLAIDSDNFPVITLIDAPKSGEKCLDFFNKTQLFIYGMVEGEGMKHFDLDPCHKK